MKITSGGLSKDTLELINAWGPYNHSYWDGFGIRVTNEERLTGRADFLVKEIREIILKNFTIPQIKKMSIADIGCYDGWILHKLSDLPFKKMIGIEPRVKNIQKGEKIRKLFNINTKVKFKKGDIDSLTKKESFDIVLCIGVLHHLEATLSAIRKLDKITSKILIINTIVLPSAHITNNFKNDIEMKDLVYQEKKNCGLTGEKYESSYYDGSTAGTSIISIPTKESLMMYLDIMGYYPVKLCVGPKDFKKAMPKNDRTFEEILLYAIKSHEKLASKDMVSLIVKKYETGLMENKLNVKLVECLYNHYVKKLQVIFDKKTKIISNYIENQDTPPNSLATLFSNHFHFEIVKNFKFNPIDKISFEWGKILYSKKNYQEAIIVFQSITQKINSDWRSVYKSFYLLSEIYKKTNNSIKYRYYKKLCRISNPNFPLL